MEYFRPYEGKNPYVFISYAHRNSGRVLPTAARLHEERYRVWYDEGIPAGKDWPRSVKEHLQSCGCVLFFRSERSLASDNCFSEISTARSRKIPVYIIALDDTVPEERWKNALADAEIIADESIEERLTERFLRAPNEKDDEIRIRRRLNGWIVLSVLAALLLIGTLAGAYGLANGWFPELYSAEEPVAATIPESTPAPVQTVSPQQWENIFSDLVYLDFPDTMQKEAVQLMLRTGEEQIPTDRAGEITELYFCGTFALESDEKIHYENGSFKVGTASPAQGRITDLTFLSEFLNLQKLVLVNQKLTSLQKLGGLPGLRELNAAGCSLSSLESLKGFPALEVLHIEHTKIGDLTPLRAIPNLKTVMVSADMLPLELDSDAAYDVILVN